MDSNNNKEGNFLKAKSFFKKALEDKPDIVCFSEMFLYWGDEKIKMAENINSEKILAFQELAKENKVNIVLGSVSLKAGIDKTTNTTLVIDRKGNIVHRYDKIYMYKVVRDDLLIDEFNTTVSGKNLGIFELDGVKMGVGICFDLRFPEYFRELTKAGAEIIFLPTSMRRTTGEIAWDVLTKARAIENQLYFCACDQTGETGLKERCGNTRIVSFDGKIIKDIAFEEGIISADLDLEKLRNFRKEFPVLEQIK